MRALLAALLLLPALSGAALADQAPFLEVRMDPRFELLAMVQLLAGADRQSSAFFRHDIPYDRAAEAWFKPYARHPVVEKYQELERKGFDYVELYTFLFTLTNPPELRSTVSSGDVPAGLVEHAGGAASLKEFQLLLADFAKASRFQEFYDAQAKERAGLVALATAPLAGYDLEEHFRGYTGWTPPARETLIISPFAEPVLSVTFRSVDADGTPRITCLYGPETHEGKFGFRLQTRFAQLLLEEVALKLETEALPLAPRLEKSAALYPAVGKACGATWDACVRRQLAVAVGDRLLYLQGSHEMAALWPIKYARIGMPHLAPLIERLKEYEAHRDRYPTLTAFLPRMIDVFDDLASKGVPTPPFLGRFDDSWRAPGPTAVILPGGPSAEAFRAVARRLASRRPGAEMLTGEAALKADLKGKTLIVLGTPADNAWLGRRWGDLQLPSRLDAEGIRFSSRSGEETFPVFPGTLGFASTALNPDDATKPVLLFTGVSAGAALAATSFDPALADYAVLSGTSPVKVGDYEKSFLPWRIK